MRPCLAIALTVTALLAAGCGGTAKPEAALTDGHADMGSGEKSEADEALFQETVLYVITDGLAYREPDETSEASMRIAVDDRFRILEERPGWYRVETEWKEIPAWLPAATVRTAVEAAPLSVVNERLGSEP